MAWLPEVLRVGAALAPAIYKWIADPQRDNKQAVFDALDAFRKKEHERAIEKIRKKYGGER
jgi:hypothetical protein